MEATLYDRLGGFAAVSSVVSRFYELVCADMRLARYFEGIDVSRLVEHQVQFLCGVLGGPQAYEGRDLRRAHAHLAISEDAFANVAGHLVTALREHDVAERDINTVTALLHSLKAEVVSAHPSRSVSHQ